MHGIVFTSFRHFVTMRFGDDVAKQAWMGKRMYLVTAAYSDEEFLQLFGEVVEQTGSEPDALLRDFGVFAGERTFVLLYPHWFTEAGGARTFLLGVERHIHDLVRATMPDAAPPVLEITERGDDGVRIAYRSPRRLCVLLEGLLVGTARHYRTAADYEQTSCMLRGDEACVYDVTLRSG